MKSFNIRLSPIHHHSHYQLRKSFSGFRQFPWVWRPREDPRRAHLQREDRQEVHGERHGDRHLCLKHQTMILLAIIPTYHDDQCSRIGWWEPSLRCDQGRAGQGLRLPSTESSSLWSPWSSWSSITIILISIWLWTSSISSSGSRASSNEGCNQGNQQWTFVCSKVIVGHHWNGYHGISSVIIFLIIFMIISYHRLSSMIIGYHLYDHNFHYCHHQYHHDQHHRHHHLISNNVIFLLLFWIFPPGHQQGWIHIGMNARKWGQVIVRFPNSQEGRGTWLDRSTQNEKKSQWKWKWQ